VRAVHSSDPCTTLYSPTENAVGISGISYERPPAATANITPTSLFFISVQRVEYILVITASKLDMYTLLYRVSRKLGKFTHAWETLDLIADEMSAGARVMNGGS